MSEKICLITGGISGIGLATAKKFLNEGYSVAVASMEDESEITENYNELKELGNVIYIQCNVADVDQARNAVEKTIEEYGKLDVLVNNAGVVGERKNLVDADLKDITNTINVNLIGSINMAQPAAQHMQKNGSGTIVNIGSLCGFIANGESIGYHASKGGIKMFTQALARELGKDGVRVVSVAPGWVNTGLITPDMEAMGAELHMRKDRIIEPEEIANIVYLVTTEDARGINGTTVFADDGYTAFKGDWEN